MTRKLDLLLPLEASCERGWVDLPFPIPARFTLRSAGDMRDPVARNRVLAAMDLEPRRVVMVRQVHSRVVVDARMLVGSDSTSASEDRVEADGIVCAADGPVLAVGVGDCAPIYVADLRTGAYALVHSGWRGTGILRSAVESMYDRFGSRPSDLVVTIGPCISGEAYVVDDERARVPRVGRERRSNPRGTITPRHARRKPRHCPGARHPDGERGEPLHL